MPLPGDRGACNQMSGGRVLSGVQRPGFISCWPELLPMSMMQLESTFDPLGPDSCPSHNMEAHSLSALASSLAFVLGQEKLFGFVLKFMLFFPAHTHTCVHAAVQVCTDVRVCRCTCVQMYVCADVC